MTPADLTAWRSRMGWTAKEAAAQLGLSQNGYAAYERGYVKEVYPRPTQPTLVDRIPRPIPKHVELACAAIEAGLGQEVGSHAAK